MTKQVPKPPKCRGLAGPMPYLAWCLWMERMSKRYRQVRCREHGLFHNWALKARRKNKGKEGRR
jgi:hypothetical protein